MSKKIKAHLNFWGSAILAGLIPASAAFGLGETRWGVLLMFAAIGALTSIVQQTRENPIEGGGADKLIKVMTLQSKSDEK